MALVADDGLIGVAMTQAVRHIIIMVWGTGLALGYFACIARALRVRAERKIYKGIIFVALGRTRALCRRSPSDVVSAVA